MVTTRFEALTEKVMGLINQNICGLLHVASKLFMLEKKFNKQNINMCAVTETDWKEK